MKLIITCSIISAAFIGNSYILLTSIKDVKDEVVAIKTEVESLKSEIILYKTNYQVKLTPKERECLTKNVFEEAGVESHVGKLAVSQVTYNRLKSGRWGKDVCSVVYHKAQFSWTLSKKKRNSTPSGKLWNASVEAVKDFESGLRIENLETSKFYHTDYIKTPHWVDKQKELMKIGSHIFYSTARKA